MGSHSVTFHPTQVNTPHYNPSQQFTYPGEMEGWVDLGSPIAAWPGIEPTTARSQVRRPNHYANKLPDDRWQREIDNDDDDDDEVIVRPL